MKAGIKYVHHSVYDISRKVFCRIFVILSSPGALLFFLFFIIRKISDMVVAFGRILSFLFVSC